MNSKFTKGPWEVAEGSPYRVMSATIHRGVNTKFGVFICDTANNAKTRTPENAANARLIAAAPTMLEALKAYIAIKPWKLGKDSVFEELTAKVESAIKLAEGE